MGHNDFFQGLEEWILRKLGEQQKSYRRSVNLGTFPFGKKRTPELSMLTPPTAAAEVSWLLKGSG